MRYFHSLIFLVGRILMGSLFLLSGIGKFNDPAGTAAYMAAKGMTMIPFFLYSAAIIEVVAGLGLIIGWKTRWAGLALLLFTIPTTYIFHDFWNAEGTMHFIQIAMFSKNLAIMGGLLYVIGMGAGHLSVDACCCNKGCKKEGDHKA